MNLFLGGATRVPAVRSMGSALPAVRCEPLSSNAGLNPLLALLADYASGWFQSASAGCWHCVRHSVLISPPHPRSEPVF